MNLYYGLPRLELAANHIYGLSLTVTDAVCSVDAA
jgi:hypothetical protein